MLEGKTPFGGEEEERTSSKRARGGRGHFSLGASDTLIWKEGIGSKNRWENTGSFRNYAESFKNKLANGLRMHVPILGFKIKSTCPNIGKQRGGRRRKPLRAKVCSSDGECLISRVMTRVIKIEIKGNRCKRD